VYCIWTLTGLWAAVRLPFYVLLFLGTFMVVFFGRCSITLVLKQMPWNRDRAPRLV
jgi:prepilin signal peptidase PulO-like enzyme (type II secretory pathway)